MADGMAKHTPLTPDQQRRPILGFCQSGQASKIEDVNETAFRTLAESTGQGQELDRDAVSAAAAALGRRGGLKVAGTSRQCRRSRRPPARSRTARAPAPPHE